jgi:hypothetical protein
MASRLMSEPRTRRAVVDGFPALTIDGLMSTEESTRLFQWLCAQPFTRTEIAREDTRAFRHWVWNIPVEDCARMPLYKAATSAVAAYLPERGAQRCVRTYCNSSGYGDMLFTHTDMQPDSEGLTALWYITPNWDIEWGGETLLFNAAGDAEFVASPRPGRLLVFDGRIRHAGRAPNRVCAIPRLTFALKFLPAG